MGGGSPGAPADENGQQGPILWMGRGEGWPVGAGEVVSWGSERKTAGVMVIWTLKLQGHRRPR